MQEFKAQKPIESPDVDPVSRLIERLTADGFSSDQNLAEWEQFGEIIYRRPEKLPLTSGETIFIFTRIDELNERILRRTSETIVKTYSARNAVQKALSVMQSTTVYHCLVTTSDQPHNVILSEYIARSGGATFIPVVIIPQINEVLYPNLEDKVGTIRPRVEYLQYLLGERRETVNMHKPTIQAMWVSVAVVLVVLIAIVVSLIG